MKRLLIGLMACVWMTMASALQAQTPETPETIARELEALAARVRTLTSTPATAPIVVAAGGNLQDALIKVVPGQDIVLKPGARFVGTFRAPKKPFGKVITIRSEATLPERRVTDVDRPLMPILVPASNEGALVFEGTANWRVQGIAFESLPSGAGEIIVIQDSDSIALDRLYVVAGANGQKRGVRGNGTNVVLTRSHFANIWVRGQDSQCFAAWEGANYLIADNFLECASENILFGGADSRTEALHPRNALVERNHLTKNLAWKPLANTGIVVKNLFEAKAIDGLIVRDNLLEHNWKDGQDGDAVVFTTRNQDGRSPWSRVAAALFERNIVRGTKGCVQLLGHDDEHPSGRLTGLVIRRNLFVCEGRFLHGGGEVGDVTIDHNTIINDGTLLSLWLGVIKVAAENNIQRPARFSIQKFTFTNNVGEMGEYGIWGENAPALGTAALTANAPGFVWLNNGVAVHPERPSMPLPLTTIRLSQAEHRAQFASDYSLVAGSRYRAAATDGTDLGR